MRTHSLVHEDAQSNTFLITWPPGSGLDWHGHGDSTAQIVILSGRLLEHRSSTGAEPNGAAESLWPDYLYHRPRGARHRIENVSTEPCVSLHTYRPPLTEIYPADLEI